MREGCSETASKKTDRRHPETAARRPDPLLKPWEKITTKGAVLSAEALRSNGSSSLWAKQEGRTTIGICQEHAGRR